MTKRNQRKRFFEACLKWLELLGLAKWELTTRLRDIDQDAGTDWRNSASVETRPENHSIIVTGDEKTISGLSDSKLDETAGHEIMHAVLAQMDELTKDMIDQLPARKRKAYDDWRSRELEEVATRIEAVVLKLHTSPKAR